MIGGKRYDYPGLSEAYIAKEQARKRLARKRAWVEKWWPRIEAEVEGNDNGKHPRDRE